MREKASYVLTTIVIVLAASVAYTYTYYQGQVSSLQSRVASLTEQLAGYQYNITLVDDQGHVVVLPHYAEKVVSLAPSNTEILFAIGAGDKVVGVTKWDNYPYNFTEWAEEGRITIVGGVVDPSVEAIASLNPDLILASPLLSIDALKKLRDLGYNVLVLDPKNINDILKNILLVGRATGHEIEASALVKSMKMKIDRITNIVARAEYKPKVYFEVWNDPLMSAGPGTWIDELIRLAGGINVFGNVSVQWPVVSSESVIELNPDVILVPTYHGSTPYTIEEIKSRPGWDQINAVKDNKIYKVDPDTFSRPGPRIVEALEILAKILHPELFENVSLSGS